MTVSLSAVHRALLGEALAALVEARGTPREVTLLTTLPSRRSDRASFRIELTDGTRFKGRRLASSTVAERVAALTPHLEPGVFAAIVERREHALLEDWVEGEPPGASHPRAALARWCGEVLARVHAAKLPVDLRARFGGDVASWRARTRRNVTALIASGALGPPAETQAGVILDGEAPPRTRTGLVHGDLCPDNLVVTPGGTLAVVDNETVHVDDPAYDLARTCHRWAFHGVALETHADARALFAGYRSAGDPSGYLRHRRFWDLAVLAESAAFRVAGELPDAPLDALRRVLAPTFRG